MDFIRGQNTLYFSWDFDYQNMISGPLSCRVFRETGPRSSTKQKKTPSPASLAFMHLILGDNHAVVHIWVQNSRARPASHMKHIDIF